ncbi:PorP/SprF family type IX secretion system membrane protein [Ferruginibacter albus]|uniref:PorP/SprF family type IX secretion system membrane protein n=1 Tax=Ferruginibacter albus TaxID=2875540 RepID=UPI001CC5C2D5|nr:PorP/SprF family type IX secretion system membrane protein [Ferruginibacter albus]UAY52683.1 PorP/SprF family type IX secretion system membrane protein [Ferruginibacter albus]
MNWKRKILLLIIGCAPFLYGEAQDLHFSQFYNSPLTANPANTGFIPDADYRFGGTYRNQWSSILSSPYRTFSVFGDAQVMRNKFENGWLGLGGVILSDVAGSGNMRSTKVYGSLAYHQMLGESSLLSAGFNLGWANKRIDVSKLVFPDQFDGKFFDAGLPTSVVLTNTNVSYFDIQVGMNYAYFPNENTYVHFGYSLLHVNQPRETFFTEGEGSIIPMRHVVFADAMLKVNDRVILNPNGYFTTQANATETILGLTLNYDLSGDKEGDRQLILGLYDRLGDALIPTAGLEINNIRFTFSYDVTNSSLSNFNSSQGAQELSIIKKGFYNNYNGDKRQSLCPQF